MSDAIGSGGGGGNFNILDPLGLGGIVQGLVSGLVGEAGKALKGPDMSCIAQVGQQLLNKVGSFEQCGGAQAVGQDAGQSGPATEFVQSKDSTVAQDGYQPIADHGETMDATPDDPSQTVGQRGSSAQADTAQDASQTAGEEDQGGSGERGQSSSAATAAHGSSGVQEAQNQEELEALTPFLAYANAVDHYGVAGDVNDGLFNRDSLARVANDPGMPAELRNGAQYILDHPKMMQTLQISTGKGDGSISNASVSAYVTQLIGGKATGANPGIQSVQQSPPSSTSGTVAQNSRTSPGGQTTSTTHASPPTGVTQQDTGLNGIVDRLDGRLDKIQTEIDAQAKVLEDPNATDAQIRAAQTQMTKLSQKMQMIMEQRKAMFELISNLAKAFNDMQMVAIRHIG